MDWTSNSGYAGGLSDRSETGGADVCDLLAGYGTADLAELGLREDDVAAGVELISPGDAQPTIKILLQGWACRHTRLKDGRRQISAFMFPGDIGSCWTPLKAADGEGVKTLTVSRVLHVRADRLGDLARRDPVMAARLRRADRADFAILSAWLTNVGLRKAPARTAYLLCELDHRLRGARGGRAANDQLLPLAQQDVADALGMTSVHVNRVFQRLRAHGFVDIRKGALILRDVPGLARLCDYAPDYLPANLD